MSFFSLKSNQEIFVTNPFGFPLAPRWENYVKAVTRFDIGIFFRNSTIVVILSMFFGITFALMFTYVIARVRNRLTKTLHSVIMLGMFIPIQAVMIPLVVMVKNLGLINTFWSLIVPYATLSFPFAVMVLYGFYLSLPLELEESAFIDGAGFFRTYFSIIFPQMKSAIAVLLIYQFISNWNEFSLALILITKNNMKTLPLGLAGFWGAFSTDWGPIGASLVIASIPVIILYFFFSSQISDAMTYSGMKN
ncbi:MAG: carbohydrate ABC transporter permease [Treponema sp.]|jgi:raffinose/stachyose/melibiose transport system permease protein|nr:carbohydrate ABC transporter permease [Treponema sp.]